MSDPGAERGRSTGGRRAPAAVREARTTVRNWAPYVGVAGLFFLAVTVVGAVFGGDGHSSLLPVQSPGEPVAPLEPFSLFLEDVQAAALIVVGTVFVLPSVALVGYTAFQLGAAIAGASGSFGPITTISLLLPHGIFELPAVWFAGAISLRWMHVAWQLAQGDDRRASVDRIVIETAIALLLVVLLLAVAAVVEGTITKDLAQSAT